MKISAVQVIIAFMSTVLGVPLFHFIILNFANQFSEMKISAVQFAYHSFSLFIPVSGQALAFASSLTVSFRRETLDGRNKF
jgi:hypothetical protein